MFNGIIKMLGGLLGEAVIEEFEDRVSSTLDNAKIRIERIAEAVIRKLIAVSFLIVGLVFGLVGLGIYLSASVQAFEHGIGFVVVGLFIILMALLVRLSGNSKERAERY